MNTKNEVRKPKNEKTRENDRVINVRGTATIGVRRARMHRLARIGFKAMVILSAVVMLLVLVKNGYERIFLDSDHFVLERIDVRTNGRTDRAKVLAMANVREGMNLLKVDLAEIKTALQALPQVETVTVRRQLPHVLEIRLDERVPVAWISCQAQSIRPRSATMGLMVDAMGRLFRCDILTADLIGLPVLDLKEGLDTLQAGGHLTSRQSKAALRALVGTGPAEGSGLPRLVSASVRNGYTIEVRTEDGVEAWLGLDDPIDDYRQFAPIVREFSGGPKRLAFANLLPRRNIAVRFADEPATPAANPGRAAQPVKRPRVIEDAPAPGRPAAGEDLSNDVRAILNRR